MNKYPTSLSVSRRAILTVLLGLLLLIAFCSSTSFIHAQEEQQAGRQHPQPSGMRPRPPRPIHSGDQQHS